MKVLILKIVEIKNYNFKRVFIININLYNKYKRYRKIEIGCSAFYYLKLNIGSKIIIYENENKKGDFKVNYKKTFELYNKKYIPYYK